MFKNALISVSDKTGLAEFVGPLVENGMRVVSSGGTAKYLSDAGIPVVKVSEQTTFPEVMGGRVKTLHPYVHMPLLYRDLPEDRDVLRQHNLEPFDLVIVNLYPFGKGLEQNKSFAEMVELVDIGGPTLLRAAAKNFQSICVLVDPADYGKLPDHGDLTLEDRKAFAGKVFAHVSSYDRKISNYLTEDSTSHDISGNLVASLRYGENPQQQGSWFRSQGPGLHDAEVIQGKPLSYNNIVDLDGACKTLNHFESPTVVSVMHNNPCGIASHSDVAVALERSVKADPVSVFGGIIAMNRPLELKGAEILSTMFLECVIAPGLTKEAKTLLSKKKNLRVLVWPSLGQAQSLNQDSFRSVWGGFLVQSPDIVSELPETWKVFGASPSPEQQDSLLFAWKACASLKSNAIAIASHSQTIGLGMGQVNRVDAVNQAIGRARAFHPDAPNWVLASDAFFPFADSIEVASKAGVQWVIQPGGSIRDEEVIAMAEKKNVNMVFTGQRHFLH